MTARPVALSMFPDISPDRPQGPLFGSVQTGNNAQLIRTIAPLYLRGRVLDTTYGRGKWWDLWRPADLTWHDLRKDGVDFRDLPHADEAFDAVCFDPPYVPSGGARSSGRRELEARFADAYGIGQDTAHAPKNRAELRDLIGAGIVECSRVLHRDGFLLAKGTDYVTGGRFTLGHLDFIAAAEGHGLHVHDLIVHHAEEAEAAFDGLAELLLANAPAEWRTGDPEADVVRYVRWLESSGR